MAKIRRKTTADTRYTEKRNALTPKAEKYADTVCGPAPGERQAKHDWGMKWNGIFHAKMERLASGLVK
jgi:hypothetical protein